MRQTKTSFSQRYSVWQSHNDFEASHDENQLVEDAKTDPTRFGVLYQRYAAKVYKYIRMRTGNEEDAADLTQQVFLQALKALPNYQDKKVPFSAWLFRIARNITTDAYRQRVNSIDWQFVSELSHPRSEQDLEDEAVRRESFSHLHRALSRLSQDKRELLVFRFAAGLSSREIAFAIGKSEAAVKKQLTRIIASLKTHYLQEFPDEE